MNRSDCEGAQAAVTFLCKEIENQGWPAFWRSFDLSTPPTLSPLALSSLSSLSSLAALGDRPD